jgi:Spy/CpxP family protein refolding chaperone
MKKILLLCCVLLGITAAANAQNRGMRDPATMAKGLQTQLKLTDDQTAKIQAIYTAQNASIDSARTAGADRSAFRPIMESSVTKIKALLTADQAVAFQKMVDERRARMQQGGGGGGN